MHRVAEDGVFILEEEEVTKDQYKRSMVARNRWTPRFMFKSAQHEIGITV